MCNAPPFPGAAVAGARPALFILKFTLVSVVVVPATLSIPPPARLAVFPEIVLVKAVSVAPVRT